MPRILVGYDGSDGAKRTSEEAREILAAAGVDSKRTSAAGEPDHEIVDPDNKVSAWRGL